MTASNAETPAVVAHPLTGEVLDDLDQQPPELLAHALAAVRERRDALAAGEKLLAEELRRRLKILDRKLVVFGDWEVESATGNRSEWDGDELEPVLQELVDGGVIKAGEIADVITRTPVVSASKAGALVKRLDGQAAAAVEACRTWRKSPGKLNVARSVALPAPADRGRSVPAPAPPGSSPGGDGRPRSDFGASFEGPVQSSPTDLDPEELFA